MWLVNEYTHTADIKKEKLSKFQTFSLHVGDLSGNIIYFLYGLSGWKIIITNE